MELVGAARDEAAVYYMHREGEVLYASREQVVVCPLTELFGWKLTPVDRLRGPLRLEDFGLEGHSIRMHDEESAVILDGIAYRLDPLGAE